MCLAARIISLAKIGTSLQLRPSLPPLILVASGCHRLFFFFLSSLPRFRVSKPRNCSSSRDEREDESRFSPNQASGELSARLVIHRGRINDPARFVFLRANRKPISRRRPSTSEKGPEWRRFFDSKMMIWSRFGFSRKRAAAIHFQLCKRVIVSKFYIAFFKIAFTEEGKTNRWLIGHISNKSRSKFKCQFYKVELNL